jgi:hypothetical protein
MTTMRPRSNTANVSNIEILAWSYNSDAKRFIIILLIHHLYLAPSCTVEMQMARVAYC